MSTIQSNQKLIADLIQIGMSVPEHARQGEEPAILWERVDGVVVRVGDVVVKAHATDTDAAALLVRLRVAASPALREVLLPPLREATRVDGHLVTVWPFGDPVSPDAPDAAPWEAAAALLARLHSTPPDAVSEPGTLPPMGGPGRVARAIERLRVADGTPAAAVVREAFSGLPTWARGVWPPPPLQSRASVDAHALVHGDWHLGQLVRRRAGPGIEAARAPGDTGWRLIDIDDLGLGDPAWDLARPAAWYAAGLMSPEVWTRFLSAYRASGGCAVPADGDPWPALDVPARALAIQSAALAVAEATREGRPLDEVEEALVGACRRISRVGSPPDIL